MAVKYLLENRYSYLEDLRRFVGWQTYDLDTPETAFEHQIQHDLAKARAHHQHEELGLALNGYERIRAAILKTLHPHFKLESVFLEAWQAPRAAELLTPMLASSARMLRDTPQTSPAMPATLADRAPLAPDALKTLQPFSGVGLQTSGPSASLALRLERAATLVEDENWDGAREEYLQAIKEVPETESATRGYLLRDLALIEERRGQGESAVNLMQLAGRAFETAQLPQGRYHATGALAGIFQRQGKAEDAARLEKEAVDLARQHGLHDVRVGRLGGAFSARPVGRPDVVTPDPPRPGPPRPGPIGPVPPIGSARPASMLAGAGAGVVGDAALDAQIEAMLREERNIGAPAAPPAVNRAGPTSVGLDQLTAGFAAVTEPVLLAPKYAVPTTAERSLTLLQGDGGPLSIGLGANAAQNLTKFYEQLEGTADISLLHAYAVTGPTLVAYMPYLYYFVLPMAIGDVYAAMGQHARAEQEYLSVLNYQYLNKIVEAVRVWTRLADLYVSWGDAQYRAAGNNAAEFATARATYERIIGSDGTIPAGSPLYSHAKLATLLQRAQAIAAAADATALDENPAVITPILRTRMRLLQISAGLNFFGFSPKYVPPFSFEYLQTTARYFAQHAVAVEQGYIQFKSQAENEEFRREQMDQQAELARASVELERRGLDEARAGVAVAQASVNYAETQRQNAVKARNAFAEVRWELLELAELEAWSSAAAVDEDDEVQQTISGFNYYNVSSADRSDVLADLARRRTRISHDLEAGRLAREIASAEAYKAVAEAQRALAETRVAVAQQRIAIAQLQQRQAEENRDFLDMKEFSARLWYELARTLRQISQQYLDMAIEAAALMERAYDAETGRNLRLIKFDYRRAPLNNLLGADLLLRDIDYFTLDYITTTRSKKAPLKVTLSLADQFPMAFDQLQRTGRAFFETTLDQFDRAYPGYYLQKLQNVELVFVGLSGTGAIHGTLRNIGVSTFRDAAGTVRQQVYPSDVMPLSQYEVRQDALVFRTDPHELRLFENNGIATLWQIDLPRDANDIDPRQILDIHMVLYFDAFHDENLEATVRATLPPNGNASAATSLRMSYPDELFYLRGQHEASMAFTEAMYPHNQTTRTRTALTMRVTGDKPLISGLAVRLTSATLGGEILATLDADGIVSGATEGSPIAPLHGKPIVDDWTVAIRPADNPTKTGPDGALDLRGLTDVQVFQEYSFAYR
jgi:hypothetical protein